MRASAGNLPRLAFVVACCLRVAGGLNVAVAAEPVPAAALRAQLAAAVSLASACEHAAEACVPASLPADEQVNGPNGPMSVNWQWMRDALGSARTAKANDRVQSMRAAGLHLAELTAQMDGAHTPADPEFRSARAAANTALARDEFRSAEGEPTWLDRQYARLQDLFLKAFFGLDQLGQRAPWLAPTIEWSCFLLAAAGLIYFVRRNLQRGALRIALGDGVVAGARTERDATDWAGKARVFAEGGEWREAVHALYWAAISLLESRRAWRPNAARTPREYVGLLSPGSEAQRALRALTRSLEAVWYGARLADEAQYRSALSIYEGLQATEPTHLTNLSKAAIAPDGVAPAGARTAGGGV